MNRCVTSVLLATSALSGCLGAVADADGPLVWNEHRASALVEPERADGAYPPTTTCPGELVIPTYSDARVADRYVGRTGSMLHFRVRARREVLACRCRYTVTKGGQRQCERSYGYRDGPSDTICEPRSLDVVGVRRVGPPAFVQPLLDAKPSAECVTTAGPSPIDPIAVEITVSCPAASVATVSVPVDTLDDEPAGKAEVRVVFTDDGACP